MRSRITQYKEERVEKPTSQMKAYKEMREKQLEILKNDKNALMSVERKIRSRCMSRAHYSALEQKCHIGPMYCGPSGKNKLRKSFDLVSAMNIYKQD